MPRHFVWIEDDWPIMMPLMEPLQEAGHRLTIVSSKKEALSDIELLRSVDLIFLDLIIPHGDKRTNAFKAGRETDAGMELAQTLVTKLHIQTPIVVMTVVRSQSVHKRLRDMGLRTILVKPVLITEVEEAITEHLGEDWRTQ